jgi:hypothetical protein
MSRVAARHKLPPGGDISPAKAAERLGLSLAQFEAIKYSLYDRKFPMPDETTGNYSLEAIEVWRAARYPYLLRLTEAPSLTPEPKLRDAREKLGARDRG